MKHTTPAMMPMITAGIDNANTLRKTNRISLLTDALPL
jgi:hypothetical protein